MCTYCRYMAEKRYPWTLQQKVSLLICTVSSTFSLTTVAQLFTYSYVRDLEGTGRRIGDSILVLYCTVHVWDVSHYGTIGDKVSGPPAPVLLT